MATGLYSIRAFRCAVRSAMAFSACFCSVIRKPGCRERRTGGRSQNGRPGYTSPNELSCLSVRSGGQRPGGRRRGTGYPPARPRPNDPLRKLPGARNWDRVAATARPRLPFTPTNLRGTWSLASRAPPVRTASPARGWSAFSPSRPRPRAPAICLSPVPRWSTAHNSSCLRRARKPASSSSRRPPR